MTPPFSAPVPALKPGSYYVLVQVDSLYQVPDPNRANNTAASNQINVSLPALVLGTPFERLLHGSRPGSLLPGDRPGRRRRCPGRAWPHRTNRERGPLCQPGDSAHPVQLPGNGRRRQFAEPDGHSSASVEPGHLLHPGPQHFRGRCHGRLHTYRHANQCADRVLARRAYSAGNGGDISIPITGTNFSPTTTASLTLGGTTINAAIDYRATARSMPPSAWRAR